MEGGGGGEGVEADRVSEKGVGVKHSPPSLSGKDKKICSNIRIHDL